MLKTLCIHLIRLYRFFLSPWLGNQCRFHPSCSQYALDALAYHGTFKGLLLMIWRLLRCHPWARGGVDEVPGLLPPPFIPLVPSGTRGIDIIECIRMMKKLSERTHKKLSRKQHGSC